MGLMGHLQKGKDAGDGQQCTEGKNTAGSESSDQTCRPDGVCFKCMQSDRIGDEKGIPKQSKKKDAPTSPVLNLFFFF